MPGARSQVRRDADAHLGGNPLGKSILATFRLPKTAAPGEYDPSIKILGSRCRPQAPGCTSAIPDGTACNYGLRGGQTPSTRRSPATAMTSRSIHTDNRSPWPTTAASRPTSRRRRPSARRPRRDDGAARGASSPTAELGAGLVMAWRVGGERARSGSCCASGATARPLHGVPRRRRGEAARDDR